MTTTKTPSLSRRGFMGALGALVVAVQLPRPVRAAVKKYLDVNEQGTLSAFLGIAEDGTITFLSPSQEMGQGSSTGLAQCVADEMDARWEDMKVVHADEAKAFQFAMLPGDPRQMTGGSLSIRTWRMPLRKAGAQARAVLVAAAAARWGVKAEECTTANSVVSHPSGKQATYGELAAEAALLKPPRRVKLKDPSQFTLMGKPVPREDGPAKVTGTADFGVDVRIPGMVRAYVVNCPIAGGAVASVDDSAARAMPGVADVLVFDDFVAVISKSWWLAKQAAAKLEIQWNGRGNENISSADISAALHAAMDEDKEAHRARKSGNALKALERADTVIEATYEVPYLEHATMEPMNCTVHIQDDRCDVWVGTQGPTRVRRAVEEITGLPAEQIRVHTLFLGGGYGRRGNFDWTEQAIHIATRVSGPVQVLWSREETMRTGRYRPAIVSRFRAAFSGGEFTGMHARFAGDNSGRSYMEGGFITKLGIYKSLVAEGMSSMDALYTYPSVNVDVVMKTFHLNVGFWRSVNSSYTAFMRETFIDEIAEELGQDPIAFRRTLLTDKQARIHAVLDRLIAESGWGNPPAGHFQGVGLVDWGGSFSAQVVEISIEDDKPRIQRVTAVLDCGCYVNPNQTKAQVMGGSIFGLSSALGEAITVKDGKVEQSNFHDYHLMRMNQSPFRFDVHLMEQPDEEPRGVGEPGTPPGIPALCNAIYAATGKRVRTLPIPRKLSDLA